LDIDTITIYLSALVSMTSLQCLRGLLEGDLKETPYDSLRSPWYLTGRRHCSLATSPELLETMQGLRGNQTYLLPDFIDKGHIGDISVTSSNSSLQSTLSHIWFLICVMIFPTPALLSCIM
uniref:Uncharacterized protein n=1 Tax=Neogobius melanostomus TaxID=47308 RepID=A0A8C6SIH3_9GOBI